MPAKNQVISTCAHCGVSVSKPASQVKWGRVFCGWTCYDARRQAECLVTKLCEGCGVPVTRKGRHKKGHTFCSRDCYLASEFHSLATRQSNERRFPDGKVELTCPHCAQAFYLAPSQTVNRKFCSRVCMKAYAIEQPVRQTARGGYIKVFVGVGTPGALGSGHILEHRWVMQQQMGRPLLKHENVHHLNGDRTDNRLENLELWSKSQPCGQRVVDKIRWAREFLAQYEDLPLP